MEIVPIFAGRLYSFRYSDRNYTEYYRIFRDWNDIEYLDDFFEENKSHFKESYHGESLDSTIFDIPVKAREMQRSLVLASTASTNKLDTFFKPLDQNIVTLTDFPRQKSYSSGNPSLLRVYALKIDSGIYAITGGAIKLTGSMKDAENLKSELRRMSSCQDYLKNQGITDIEGFNELFI